MKRARKVGSEARVYKCCRAFQVHDHDGMRTENKEVGGKRKQEREQKRGRETGDEGPDEGRGTLPQIEGDKYSDK